MSSFSTQEPIGPQALLAALIREYGGDLVAPGAPFDDVVPPLPDGPDSWMRSCPLGLRQRPPTSDATSSRTFRFWVRGGLVHQQSTDPAQQQGAVEGLLQEA